MRVLSEQQDIRRRSFSVALFMHIPVINYLFFIAIIIGSYLSVKNFYLFNKRNPGPFELLRLTSRYIYHSTLRAGMITLFLLGVFAVNPFGRMLSFYWEELHSLVAGLNIDFSLYQFGKVANLLGSVERDWRVFVTVLAFIFIVFIAFTFLGIVFGLLTNKLQEDDKEFSAY